jgi:hypothetical protein
MQGLQKPLALEEIEFMPKTFIESTGKALLLAYKDARCDMKRLDEAAGGLWQNEYKRDSKGVLQCGIGIKLDGEWVWKWSNGVPSDHEKVKGEYSDAFKRAGFMWGIGRELYEFPTIWAQPAKKELSLYQGKTKLNGGFRPMDWLWKHENGRLIAVDANNNERVNIRYGKQ